MSVYLLVLYALFACVDAVNDLDVFSLSVSYSVVLVNQETVYMIRSFACVGYASIEGDHWSPKATFLLWELRHVARADSLTSESAHAEKYNSIVDTRSLDKIDTRAHMYSVCDDSICDSVHSRDRCSRTTSARSCYRGTSVSGIWKIKEYRLCEERTINYED
ncbi:hypothetical protein Tco_0400908 [Tanacetum coccineum]|uniref:Secreted protein n=1 Tax=Tanacetum coccineum TaxID=301880 RepID=A0ABQ5JG40_9ASTR